MDDENNVPQLTIGENLEGRWLIVRKLGEGSFGAVYEAQDTKGQIPVNMALKLESCKIDDQVLKLEVQCLLEVQRSKHVCRIYSAGCNLRFNFMLMGLLGQSVDDLRKDRPSKTFTDVTCLKVIAQCVDALKDMHECGWLHRDVKPSNFAIGPTPQTIAHIFIFDFGLARQFIDPVSKALKPARDWMGFRGTNRYCSINMHLHKELGRHDDLISLCYMFVELVVGQLPWKGIENSDKVLTAKLAAHANLYRELPPQMVALHNYLHALKYDMKPEYTRFHNICNKIIVLRKLQNAHMDWEIQTTPSSKVTIK